MKKKCPKCKKHYLLWHLVEGMRLKREVAGKMVYDVYCADCGDFTLPAPRN
jgi:hypothetical protein